MSYERSTLARGRRWAAIAVPVVALLAASCTGQQSDPPPQASAFAYGIWGDPSDADHTIEIVTRDEMRFDPEAITVERGDTITFDVTNEGKVAHEFTIGDPKTQKVHERHMSGGDEVHDHPNSVYLEPRGEKSLTWTFSEAGDFLYGCHVPGHYAAGMVGTIEVR